MHLGLGDEIMTSFFEPFTDRTVVDGGPQQPHPSYICRIFTRSRIWS